MSAFKTNCSLPAQVTSYVSSPNTRGTLDILWTCLGIMLLCTWSTQHPNVPSHQHPSATAKGPSKSASTSSKRNGWRKGIKQTKMMLLSILAPEFLLMKAIGDFNAAKSLTKYIEKRAEQDGVKWSLVHSFFANMGGFVVKFPEDVNSNLSEDEGGGVPCTDFEDRFATMDSRKDIDCERGLGSSSMEQSPSREYGDEKMEKPNPRLCRMLRLRSRILSDSNGPNGVLIQNIFSDFRHKASLGQDTGFSFLGIVDTIINLVRLRGSLWALDGPQLLLAREMGIIETLPDIGVDDIGDRSDGDWLVKMLAVGHAGWQMAQLIVRFAMGLPSSQLEVATDAFALLAFGCYLLMWSKPQAVDAPFFLEAKRFPTRKEMMKLAKQGPTHPGGLYAGDGYEIPEHALHVNPGSEAESMDGPKMSAVCASIGGVLFGLIHCVAWSFHFPSEAERFPWRLASLGVTIVPVFFTLYSVWNILVSDIRRKERRESWKYKVVNNLEETWIPILGGLLSLGYVIARLFLIVETLRSVFFLLPDTFVLYNGVIDSLIFL